MAFTQDDANVVHYPGTAKEHVERGFEPLPMPPQGQRNGIARVMGKTFNTNEVRESETTDFEMTD